MNTDAQVFAIYLTAATTDHPAGYVVNNVVCDGSSTPTVSTGQAAVADPDRQYPIGSAYSTVSS